MTGEAWMKLLCETKSEYTSNHDNQSKRPKPTMFHEDHGVSHAKLSQVSRRETMIYAVPSQSAAFSSIITPKIGGQTN